MISELRAGHKKASRVFEVTKTCQLYKAEMPTQNLCSARESLRATVSNADLKAIYHTIGPQFLSKKRESVRL